MSNILREVDWRRKARAGSAFFGPYYAISRARHRLEGMAFAFSENRREGTFRNPVKVGTLSKQAIGLVKSFPPLERTLTLLAAATGFRISECLGLQWQDVEAMMKPGLVN